VQNRDKKGIVWGRLWGRFQGLIGNSYSMFISTDTHSEAYRRRTGRRGYQAHMLELWKRLPIETPRISPWGCRTCQG
jgi:hypothetical protein